MRIGAMQVLDQMKRTTAPVTVVGEVDMTNLIRLRSQIKPRFERQTGIKLTYTPFFARATVKALQAYPMLNGSLGSQGYVIPRRVDLGIATQAPGVVVIPTIFNAERKSVPALAHEIHVLGQRAKAGGIGPGDMNCTFVITNTGKYARSLFGAPTIKPPNTGILAFEAITKRPVVTEDDRIVVRPMMYLALTADHRAVDGAEMTGFLGKVTETLENLSF
jgi:pyruvate/2-oxoglutarate dehydrogenase complex dihydrolipoamide acyltransferase (E2) component